MRRSLWVCVLAAALCACGAGDFTLSLSVPTQPVAADGQTPAAITVQALESGAPIDASRSGTLAFSTDVGSLVPIDVDGGGSAQPELSNQMATFDVAGAPIPVTLYSALPGTAHILVRYTDQYSAFAIARATVTFQ